MGSASTAWSINDSGQVAGSSEVTHGSDLNHAFLSSHDGTSLLDFGTHGDQYSAAYGINNLGHVVGLSGIDGAAEFGVGHAFLYDGSEMLDLNNLISADSG